MSEIRHMSYTNVLYVRLEQLCCSVLDWLHDQSRGSAQGG